MDDEAALLARRVALAASAWMRVPADVQAYAHLVEAVERWNAYAAPKIYDGDELLDAAVDDTLPQPLGESVAGLEVALRAAARKQL